MAWRQSREGEVKLVLAVKLSSASRDWNLERSRQLIFKGTVAKRKELYKERALEILREDPLRVWLSNDRMCVEECKERTRNSIS